VLKSNPGLTLSVLRSGSCFPAFDHRRRDLPRPIVYGSPCSAPSPRSPTRLVRRRLVNSPEHMAPRPLSAIRGGDRWPWPFQPARRWLGSRKFAKNPAWLTGSRGPPRTRVLSGSFSPTGRPHAPPHSVDDALPLYGAESSATRKRGRAGRRLGCGKKKRPGPRTACAASWPLPTPLLCNRAHCLWRRNDCPLFRRSESVFPPGHPPGRPAGGQSS